jgi:ABC-2 type transport system ATP-binding protein
MTHVIEIDSLSKRYGAVEAVRRLDLSVGEGEIFGFLGPNGAGKTTTIRVLTGFLRPTDGRASVFGLDSWADSLGIKERIGFLPDAPRLYDGLSGREFLDYMTSLQNSGRPVLRQHLCDGLELDGATLQRQIKGYSHGMRQKLAIAQSMQHDPDLVIMDEPTEALDPLAQQSVFELLLEFKSRGRTVFFSSHNLPEVERLCDRVGIIRDGTLVAVEAVSDLRSRELRQLEVVLAGEPPDGDLALPGVVSLQREGRRMRFVVRGDINPLVRELARLDLEDLVLEPPHLDDVFMEYYRPDTEENDASDGIATTHDNNPLEDP